MDPCEHCEQVMQPYLDRTVSAEEQAWVETHLGHCEWCAKRFHFEEEFRRYVRVAVAEPMAPELKAKLASLRTPLL